LVDGDGLAMRLAICVVRRAVAIFWALAAACSSEESGGDAGLDVQIEDAARIEDAATGDSGFAEDAPIPITDAAAPQDASEPDPEGEREDHTATCTDGIDNDEDSYVDCRDFDCDLVTPCDLTENTTTACTDGMDNDDDGYLDCRDFDCRPVSPCNVTETSSTACSDGFDNDGDQAIDCSDSDCMPIGICTVTEDTNETCSNQRDDDGNRLTDCDDPGCVGLSACDPTEGSDPSCTDGVDNDGDQQRDCADGDCAGAIACNRASVRIATFNVQTLGSVGSADYLAVLAFVRRVSPDVICFEEIESWETRRLGALARDAGYARWFQGHVTGAMAGGLTNACLSRYPFAEARSLSSDDISSDGSANETGRDFVAVRVEVVPGSRWIAVFDVHLKSGFADSDYLRRQVETIRLAQAIDQHKRAHPLDAVVVMGDFNEEIDEQILGSRISSPPSGLPSSYRLGSDLAYPFTYDPFAALAAAGIAFTDPTHEDSTSHATRIPSGRRIDYIGYLGLQLVGDEVFNACRDNGMDDPPAGDWLEKPGPQVPCASKEMASDHRLVFADFGL
jgi:endonuclease/exonuclease/phosphatase family metal-dependent hydrolase